MAITSNRVGVAWALLLALAPISPVAGQSVTTGSVSGRVVSATGEPVDRAVVTLTRSGSDVERQLTTDALGRFEIAQLSQGRFDVRAEAVGYRPLVALGLTTGAGQRRALLLTLTPTQPPVVSVDTMFLATQSSPFTANALALGSTELDDLPYRYGDLAALASLSSAFDASLGSQGLPGGMTRLFVDGVPVYRAPHPTAASELQPSPLFPRGALAGAIAMHAPSDIEWAGAAGGYIAAETRSSAPDGGVQLEGAFSGGPGWSSSALDFSAPSTTSFEGGLRGGAALTADGSRFSFSVDALRHQTPLGPRVTEGQAASLAGLDPDLLSSLAAPSVETYARYAGAAKVTVRRSPTSSVYVRGAAALVTRDFDSDGPVALSPNAAPPEESIDFSVVSGVTGNVSPTLDFEFRGGVSGSFRDFKPTGGERAPAYLTEPGVQLGELVGAVGESSRTDVVISPILHFTPRAGRFKFGSAVRASSHTVDHSIASLGDFAYSNAAGLLAGDGVGARTTSAKESFSTQEFGAFAQYVAAAAPGVTVSFGGRFDLERLRGGDVARNTDWLAASGLDNTAFPDSYSQFGARASIIWEPSTLSATRISLVGGVQEGDLDPRAVYQLFSQDTDATSTRFAGSGLDWPTPATLPAATPDLPTLTLFGPDARPPRSTTFSAGVSQPVGRVASLFVQGSLRRTDFLLRRRNLNLPLMSARMDPNGRGIFGTLTKDGALVSSLGDDARRFSDFGNVWALDPDGWSEYRGVTAGLRVASAAVQLFGSYTYSETTDNWVGAAGGHPELALPPGLPQDDPDAPEWSEGTSDFDVPHRFAGGGVAVLGPATVSMTYEYRSGLPFTPRFRYGVDANGDGSMRNDVAFVPGDSQVATILDSWPCLEPQVDSFAERNSCRGPVRHSVNARLRLELGRFGGRRASLVFDALNLVEDKGGVVDDALMLVDPVAGLTTSPDGSTVTIPTSVNPDFGSVLYPSSRGRLFRVGVRVGG